MEQVRQLVQRAEVLLVQIRMQGDRVAAQDMIIEAKDCLIQAETHAPGAGAWLLAQMSAGEGDRDRCRKWLERGARNNALPEAETVQAHPSMMPVRNETWFQAILAGLD